MERVFRPLVLPLVVTDRDEHREAERRLAELRQKRRIIERGVGLFIEQRVAEAKGTSFLGVGLMTVIVLVALMESLFSAWMFLAIPVLTALSYLAAQWVSTRFVDVEESSPGVDVR